MTRRRYVWDDEAKQLVEVGEEWSDTPRGNAGPVTDLYMEGVRATDGTDIGSRKKRRAYMKANNLADADDFKGTWEKAAKEREAIRQGSDSSRREAIARALETYKPGRR
jgi:hypothetical protein